MSKDFIPDEATQADALAPKPTALTSVAGLDGSDTSDGDAAFLASASATDTHQIITGVPSSKFSFFNASLSRRVVMLTSLAVGFAVLMVALAAYVVTRASLINRVDQELTRLGVFLADSVGSDLENMSGFNTSALRAASTLLILERADGQIVKVPGETISISPDVAELAVARTGVGSSARVAYASNGVRYRVVSVPVKLDGDRYALILARPLVSTDLTLTILNQVLLAIGFFGLALSTALMWAAWRRAARPLRQLTEAVQYVSETDKLAPVPVTSSDEIGTLAASFNTMMESLSTSRERQKRLIADAGHELRTPLTSMRTNVELLIADASSHMLPHGVRDEILKDVAAQLGEFSSLVSDLVQLSRDEQTVFKPSRIDFQDVVEASLQRARRRGPELTFVIELEPTPIMGESDSLERAVTNLLDNAVKFSPRTGTITVKLHDHQLSVADEGPGIADEDLPHIFERFFRSDRTRNTPGTGLGLSIVAHTVAAHQGTIEAGRSSSGGGLFIMTLPDVEEFEAEEWELTF